MATLTYKTFGGQPWTPQFVQAIDTAKCLGCGRCVKVCSQECLGLESYYDEDADTERYIATISNKALCIGCQACGKTCIRGCYTFRLLEV